MVFRYETEVNDFDPSRAIFARPQCRHRFAWEFARDGLLKVERERWLAVGSGQRPGETSDAP